MVAENPFEYARLCIARTISENLKAPVDAIARGFEIPREEYGDLALVLPKTGLEVNRGEEIAQITRRCDVVASARSVGIYVNIELERGAFTDIVFRSLASAKDSYGIYRERNAKRIVVEYVSANPLHPLHIGAARNAALGQFITNILRACGNAVQTRFYINDVGRQVAILALGALQLQENEQMHGIKPDHWIGVLYAVTNTVIEVQKLKKRLEQEVEKRDEILRELDEMLADASKLRKQAPELFDTMVERLRDIDAEQAVSKIMKLYESGDPEIVRRVRGVVLQCIEGFKQTLSRFGAEIEVWDWESDLVWSGEVDKVIRALESSPLTTTHKGVLAVDLGKLAADPEVRERLAIDKDLEIPPMIVRRSDGTTLYSVRDIAYTLKKFREFQADKVINVIASEQRLPQAQLRLALYMVGYRREAENLVHYSYEIVTMEGMKMSSRRGRLITLDEILDMAKARALAELKKRGSDSEELAEKIGVAAVKFYLLSASPSKPLRFSLAHALDFEKNSAPYLLYTYARTEGIFRKASEYGVNTSLDALLRASNKNFAQGAPKRWRLVKLVASFPDVFYNAYTGLDPSTLVVYTLRLADEFNSWYSEEPILLEEDEGVRASKLLLTYGVNVVIRNALKVLGIEPLERI